MCANCTVLERAFTSLGGDVCVCVHPCMCARVNDYTYIVTNIFRRFGK